MAKDFDNILSEVGEFGKFQMVQFILLGIVGIPTAWQNLASVFLAGSQDHWCSDYHGETQFSQYRINGESNLTGSFTTNGSKNVSLWLNSTATRYECKVPVLNGSGYVDCLSGWSYDTTVFQSTIISQYDLVCKDEWLVSFSTTIYMAGFLTGAIVFGTISDKIGRKKTLMITIVLQVLFGLSGAVASMYGPFAVFVMFRYLSGTTAAGAFTTAFVMVMEIIGPSWRMGPGILMQCWFALGFMILPLFAYFVRDHFMLQIVIALPVLLLLSFYWLVKESARWLLTENMPDQAEKIIRQMASQNGRRYPSDLKLETINVNNAKSSGNFFDLIRTPNLRKISLNVFFNWFVVSFGYYGLSLGSSDLGGNMYLNVFLSALVELPAYAVCCLTLNRFGRRPIFCVMYTVAGVALLACIPLFDKDELRWLLITLSMVGKFGLSAAFAIIYNYSAEVFPTVVRNVGVGSGSMCARIGSLLAPQVVRLNTYWKPLPSILYGGCALAAGVLCLFLPETHNQTLPETLEDGELFGTADYNPVKNKESEEIAMMEQNVEV